jgi:ABC-type transport system substrate-binding protein
MSVLDPQREGERDIARQLHELERTSVDRRHFLLRASALGLSAALFPRLGSAQDATPAAGGVGVGTEPGTRSLTSEEARQAIKEAYGVIDPPVQGGQIVVPSSSDFQTLNPALAADATSFQLVENMYEMLVGTNPADGTLIPGLCDYWELAEDGITFTFHLPQNVL